MYSTHPYDFVDTYSVLFIRKWALAVRVFPRCVKLLITQNYIIMVVYQKTLHTIIYYHILDSIDGPYTDHKMCPANTSFDCKQFRRKPPKSSSHLCALVGRRDRLVKPVTDYTAPGPHPARTIITTTSL